MNIAIHTFTSDNSFSFKRNNEPAQILPKVFMLEKVTAQLKQNIEDDSVGFTITVKNIYNNKVLFHGVSLEDITVDDITYPTFLGLSEVLTPLLFK